MNTIEAVVQSMMAASQATPDTIIIPSEEVMKTRLRLEFEELLEKAVAMGLAESFRSMTNGQFINLMKKGYAEGKPYVKFASLVDTHIVDVVEVLDACCDQRVVNDGTIAAFGFHNPCVDGAKNARCSTFHTAFHRVHENNMTKFPKILAEAERMRKALAEAGVVVEVKPSTALPGYFALIDENGKYRKPVNFTAVELTDLFPAKLLKQSKDQE